jgi:hypothetical protein
MSLVARFPQYWNECNRIPEDLHPKSFRSVFSHNTNVFATLDLGQLGVNPVSAKTKHVLSFVRFYSYR